MFACAAFVLHEGLFNNLTQFIMRYKKGNKWEKKSNPLLQNCTKDGVNLKRCLQNCIITCFCPHNTMHSL